MRIDETLLMPPPKSSRLPSRKRQLVIDLIEKLGRPFTMEELIAAVRQCRPEIARSTVYRAVLWLESRTRLVAGTTPTGRSVYLTRSSPVVCLAECPECGALRQLDGGEFADGARQVAAGAGLTFFQALWRFSASCPQHRKKKMNLLGWWTFLVQAPEMALPLC